MRVSDDEYRHIKASWLAWTREARKMSDHQMVDACLANVREAAQRERDLRGVYLSLPPGDMRLKGDEQTSSMYEQIITAQLDQRHWREYVAFYRRRVEAKQPSRVLPREPGSDDE